MNTSMKTRILFVLATAAPLMAQPDTFGYTATNQTPYSYVDISATGTSVLSDTDDGTATLALSFAFRFYGIAYSSICVSSNGLVSFGGCTTADLNNLDLTAQSPGGNRPLIAPFWSDLTFSAPGAGSVLYQTLGTAPNRRFAVQWNNVAVLNIPGTLNFQVLLFETTNHVLIQYKTVESASSAVSKGACCTVAIRDASGNSNGRRLQWSFKSPVLANSSAILFSAPAAGAAVDVSARVAVTSSAFILNRITQLYSGNITIRNTSTTAIARPIHIVLANLAAGVTAVNNTGTVAGTGPSFLAPGTTPLAPGQQLVIPVQFRNPTNARITFNVKTYSGSL